MIFGEFGVGWMRSRGVDWPAELWRWATEIGYEVHEVAYTRQKWWRDETDIDLRLLDPGAVPHGDRLLTPRRGARG